MQRSRRITKNQKEYMIEFCVQNPVLLKLSHPKLERELKWRELARALNAQESGTSKTTAQWKETYKDVRSGVRRKYRLSQMHGNQGSNKLTEAEKKLMSIINSQDTSGQQGYGVNDDDQSHSNDQSFLSSEDLPDLKLKMEYQCAPSSLESSNSKPSEKEPEAIFIKSSNMDKNLRSGKKTNHRGEEYHSKKGRLQERLKSQYNNSLSSQINNHSLQIEQLSKSCSSMAESMALLAQANNNIAAAINKAVEAWTQQT